MCPVRLFLSFLPTPNSKLHIPISLSSPKSHLSYPAQPSHPRTRLILLPRHRTVREPYLPTLQIHLRGTIEERPRDERLLGFGEGRRGVVFWWVRMDLD
jgi:hypothetical protein